MNVHLVEKESFCIIGKMGEGLATEGKKWIPPLWESANSNFNEIADLVRYDDKGNVLGVWGIMTDVREKFEPWGKKGKYLAGCEIDKNITPPNGWNKIEVPDYTYAVVTCSQDDYEEVFNYMLNNYLPLNSYVLGGAVQEHYPIDPRDDHIELYFPVIKT